MQLNERDSECIFFTLNTYQKTFLVTCCEQPQELKIVKRDKRHTRVA